MFLATFLSFPVPLLPCVGCCNHCCHGCCWSQSSLSSRSATCGPSGKLDAFSMPPALIQWSCICHLEMSCDATIEWIASKPDHWHSSLVSLVAVCAESFACQVLPRLVPTAHLHQGCKLLHHFVKSSHQTNSSESLETCQWQLVEHIKSCTHNIHLCWQCHFPTHQLPLVCSLMLFLLLVCSPLAKCQFSHPTMCHWPVFGVTPLHKGPSLSWCINCSLWFCAMLLHLVHKRS